MCNLWAEAFTSQYVAPSPFHMTLTSKALGGRGSIKQPLTGNDMEESSQALCQTKISMEH